MTNFELHIHIKLQASHHFSLRFKWITR